MIVQDFEDGGELYQSQVNCIARHVLENQDKHEASAISKLQENHNINVTAILAQIASEKAADQKLEHGPIRYYWNLKFGRKEKPTMLLNLPDTLAFASVQDRRSRGIKSWFRNFRSRQMF